MIQLKIRTLDNIWTPPQAHAMSKVLTRSTTTKDYSTGCPPLHLTSWDNRKTMDKIIRRRRRLKVYKRTSMTSLFKTSFCTTGPKCSVGATTSFEIAKWKTSSVRSTSCCKESTIMIIKQAAYTTSLRVSKVSATMTSTFESLRLVRESSWASPRLTLRSRRLAPLLQSSL